MSVFSLMADGRDLVRRFEENGHSWCGVVKPYVQVVDEGAECSHTGLDLRDVWRYFRLTWSNPPRSIPARQMRFLVRDAGQDLHPVMGIGEISGAAVRVSARDEFIGWDGERVWEWMRSGDPEETLNWVEETIGASIASLYVDDLPFDEADVPWTLKTVEALREIEAVERAEHDRVPSPARPDDPVKLTPEEWLEHAKTPLFRSKRAGRLADLLELHITLAPAIRGGDRAALSEAVSEKETRQALQRVVRLAKARKQGTAIADLTVCGAISPYNELIAGKLVALMAGSPTVISAYRRRYRGVPSIIASAMAGRPVVKRAELVLLTTTALYGVRPNQYDRISVEASEVGGASDARLRYVHLPHRTKGWGTFQFSAPTSAAIQRWLRYTTKRSKVTYTYGEGASPTLRLLREGLTSLGLDQEQLLTHGLEKSLYVFSLITNHRRYLLGFDEEPEFIIEAHDGVEYEERLGEWWTRRWASKRSNEEVLERLGAATLIAPVTHPARVVLPESEEQVDLFPSAEDRGAI